MGERILVAYGSKHGATAEIAERIGVVLRRRGEQVDVFPAQKVKDLSPYGQVVLGSSVYMGLWRKGAAGFLKRNEKELGKVPVWLFSSGPTGPGDPEKLLEGWRYPESLRAVVERVGPKGTACFGGKLDAEKMSAFERMVIKMVKAPTGDFRDWEAVEAWAEGIAGNQALGGSGR
ncbi:flavodoxin domain-containing protein [Anaerotalea alkaliphila]|uniref:Flavodoxin n=1 Tax=Anaerotalea alkaliphila TaxID=2662126 RepID=A0A7X5KM15_9FIRM|nr:flavodoxin domain-containing protein [Anaerotalea alkaliphila]NDL67456.1 flavodoxin [Anaerotalea alkaliphila]